MAKITITIEDKAGGLVPVISDPTFQELMRRITSGDVPSAADRVAVVALRYLHKVSKASHKFDLSPQSLIKPN